MHSEDQWTLVTEAAVLQFYPFDAHSTVEEQSHLHLPTYDFNNESIKTHI